MNNHITVNWSRKHRQKVKAMCCIRNNRHKNKKKVNRNLITVTEKVKKNLFILHIIKKKLCVQRKYSLSSALRAAIAPSALHLGLLRRCSGTV